MANKKVTVYIPRDDNSKDSAIIVGVNGVMHSVPRGKPVEVSADVAEVIALSQLGDDIAFRREQELTRNIDRNA